MAKIKINCAAALKEYDPCKGRPYNRYNIYYILERERLLQSFPGYNYKREQHTDDICPANNIITGYENLGVLPPLPPQYKKLELCHDWYMPGKRKLLNRKHKKTHGVASFQEIARVVADGWKSIDVTTLKYCTDIAKILKLRHNELKRVGGVKYLPESVKNSSCDTSSSNLVPTGVDDESLGLQKKKVRRHHETMEPCLSVLSEVDSPLGSPGVCRSPDTKQRSRFLKSVHNELARDFSSSLRSNPSPAEVYSPNPAIATICVSCPRKDSETKIHSEVDISDQDILTMWFKIV